MVLVVWLLVIGVLYEDGLVDFCDGFGGGILCDKILFIMKDLYIGIYGVFGLLFYYGLMWNIFIIFFVFLVCVVILSGDVWSKFCVV